MIGDVFGDKVETLGDLLRIDSDTLSNTFGSETATWIREVARGIDHEPVQDRSLPLSIGCSKSFRSTNNLFYPSNFNDGVVFKWLIELSQELHGMYVLMHNVC